MVDILDLVDDFSRLEDLIDRASVLHADVTENFVAPIHRASKKGEPEKVLAYAGAKGNAALIKTAMLYDILSEATGIAQTLLHAVDFVKVNSQVAGIADALKDDTSPEYDRDTKQLIEALRHIKTTDNATGIIHQLNSVAWALVNGSAIEMRITQTKPDQYEPTI